MTSRNLRGGLFPTAGGSWGQIWFIVLCSNRADNTQQIEGGRIPHTY